MRFVIRYPRRAFDCMLANSESKNRVRKSVNGFIMATYCELLGRHATPEEVEEGVHQWKGDAAWAPDLPPLGFEGRVELPTVVPPVNGSINHGRDVDVGGIISPGDRIVRPGEDVVENPGTSWGDTDWLARLDVRMRMRASEEFARTNLQRMVRRFVNPSSPVPISDLTGMGQQDVAELVNDYIHTYRIAIALDERRWELENVYDYKHQIIFGKYLYEELARRKGDPISRLTHDDRAVCAGFFPWYMTFGGYRTPGYGEFDVWTSHIDMEQGMTYAPYPGGPCDRPGPWHDQVPGNLYPVWQLENQEARNWLTQCFRDMVTAGIDIVFFCSWQRPGISMYAWLALSGDRPWWDPCARGDDWPKEYLRTAVSVLNEMKARGELTPKIACGVDSNVIAMEGAFIKGSPPSKYHNMDPLGYASCVVSGGTTRGYTAYWDDLDDDGDYLLHLDFPEVHRYMASLVREFFEEVPLEHAAFIQGRPVCSLWTVKGLDPEDHDGLIKGINRFFCAEFYGRPIWWVADKTWGAAASADPLDNFFVYMGPADPYDEAAQLYEERSFEPPDEPPPGPLPPTNDRIRIGDCHTLEGKASPKCKPWGDMTCLTVFSAYPGFDMSHKWWRFHNTFSANIADREFGVRYFRHWWNAFISGLPRRDGDGLRPLIPADMNGNDIMPQKEVDWSHVRRIWIDTWNERYEGTSIGRSREFRDAYILLTKVMSRIWRLGSYSTDPDWIVPRLLEAFTGSSLWDARFGPRPAFEHYCSRHGVLEMVKNVLSKTQPARLRHSPQVQIIRTPDPVTPLPVVREVSAEMTGPKRYLPVTVFITATGFNVYGVTGKVWIKLWPLAAAPSDWRVFQDWKEDNAAHCRLIRVLCGPNGDEGTVMAANEDYDRQKVWDEAFPLIELLVPVYGRTGMTSLKAFNIDMETLQAAGSMATGVILHVGGGFDYAGRYYHLHPGWTTFNLLEDTLDEPRL